MDTKEQFEMNQLKVIMQRKLLENSSDEDSKVGSDQYRFNRNLPDLKSTYKLA